MADVEEMKAQIKKLSARAMQLKMDLHDLSEELPLNYELVPVVAQKTFDAFAALEKARADLKALNDG